MRAYLQAFHQISRSESHSDPMPTPGAVTATSGTYADVWGKPACGVAERLSGDWGEAELRRG